MGAALVCFARAYLLRRFTPSHVRLALTGVGLDVAGTAAVLLAHRVLGWDLPSRGEGWVLWHRGFAYAASGLVLAQAVSGALRAMSVHRRVGPLLVPVYAVALALAVMAYWPF
jgi:hypothetical protein